LRAYIRNPKGKEAKAEYAYAQVHVMRLLEVQFYSRGLPRVVFDIDPKLTQLTLCMAKEDLIHVLINLFANSIENMLSHDVPQPKITVKLEENRGNQVLLSFRDTGSGLSAEEFERLTALDSDPEVAAQSILNRQDDLGGLGLRLVRRLIERYHGTLNVVPLEPGEKGTLFYFWIPAAETSVEEKPGSENEI
jgi:signal transduction histidine kinase